MVSTGRTKILDRDGERRPVERGAFERQVWVQVQVVHAAFGEPGIGVQFRSVHAETGDTPQGHLRRIVRNPGRHQVEDIGALEQEVAIPLGERLDGGLVDVLHEPRFPVKLVIGRRIDALEEVIWQFSPADVVHPSVRSASEPAHAPGRAALPGTC